MAKQTFGIGIVGCGNISDTHAKAIQESGRGKLVAAHTRSEERLSQFCNEYGIVGSTDYGEFLNTPGLEAISICTPSGTHLDYARKAAVAGKYTIVEKPIEVTLERAKILINVCRENKVKLAVIYQNRFDNEVQKMKKALKREKIGKPVLASASVRWYRSQEYYADSNWRGTLDLDGGGVVINQSIHTIDLLQWFMGKVVSVSALKGTFSHDIEAEDTAVACLRFKNGAIGVFEASTSVVPPQPRRIEINGKKGTLLLDGPNFEMITGDQDSENKNKKEQEGAGASSPLAGMDFQNHRRQYDEILNAFSKNTDPVVSGEESLQSLVIVRAIYMSAQEGRRVYIQDLL